MDKSEGLEKEINHIFRDYLKIFCFIRFFYIIAVARRGSSVVEQRPEKPCVGSSILPLATM